MVMTTVYPASPPNSDNDPASRSMHTTPETRKSHIIDMADETAPSSAPEGHLRIQGAFRRTRSPPRNDHGQMFCDHVNCRGKNQTFKRVCEWNKHMDRHERPYKCREAGCELNPGFTYSGGLLRHQREVHKMHLSTKQPLFCPFPNCNRSSGAGFTRKENLEEHKRRRHLEEMSDRASDRASSQPRSTTLAQEPALKRRRISTATDIHGGGQDVVAGSDAAVAVAVAATAAPPNMNNNSLLIAPSESQLVQHLRDELRQKEDYIRRQAGEIHRLQNMLRALPPQAIYGVMHSRMPGGGVG